MNVPRPVPWDNRVLSHRPRPGPARPDPTRPDYVLLTYQHIV